MEQLPKPRRDKLLEMLISSVPDASGNERHRNGENERIPSAVETAAPYGSPANPITELRGRGTHRDPHWFKEWTTGGVISTESHGETFVVKDMQKEIDEATNGIASRSTALNRIPDNDGLRLNDDQAIPTSRKPAKKSSRAQKVLYQKKTDKKMFGTFTKPSGNSHRIEKVPARKNDFGGQRSGAFRNPSNKSDNAPWVSTQKNNNEQAAATFTEPLDGSYKAQGMPTSSRVPATPDPEGAALLAQFKREWDENDGLDWLHPQTEAQIEALYISPTRDFKSHSSRYRPKKKISKKQGKLAPKKLVPDLGSNQCAVPQNAGEHHSHQQAASISKPKSVPNLNTIPESKLMPNTTSGTSGITPLSTSTFFTEKQTKDDQDDRKKPLTPEDQRRIFIDKYQVQKFKVLKKFVDIFHDGVASNMGPDDCWLYTGRLLAGNKSQPLRVCIGFSHNNREERMDLDFTVVLMLHDGTLAKELIDLIVDGSWQNSHLCGNWTCLNTSHVVTEPAKISLSRHSCFKEEVNAPCSHEPKCMRHLKLDEETLRELGAKVH